MENSVEKLQEIYKLSDENFAVIQKYVIASATFGKTPSEKPKAVIIGAQPGAGKTELQKIAEVEMHNNAVVCNVDNFRDFHPSAKEIKRLHEKHYPELTSKYSHAWTLGLQKHCRANQFNYILETTLQNGKGIADTIRVIKKQGFDVDLKILAVNEKVSWLGTEARYELMLKNYGCGRRVDKEQHDLRYNTIPDALKVIIEHQDFNNISIFARNIHLDDSKNTRGIRLIAENPANALKVYLQERERSWSMQETKHFAEHAAAVLEMKIQRNAPAEEIALFKSNMVVARQKSGRNI